MNTASDLRINHIHVATKTDAIFFCDSIDKIDEKLPETLPLKKVIKEVYVRTEYYEETIIDKLYNWYVRNRDKNIDFV